MADRLPDLSGSTCWSAAPASPGGPRPGRCWPAAPPSGHRPGPAGRARRPDRGRRRVRRAADEVPDRASTLVVDLARLAAGPSAVRRRGRGGGIEVIGELEFAWRLRGAARPTWLVVTGTNGKTTTVRMLESMLRADGLRALAVGNVGVSIIDAVVAAEPYDVLAVELSSFQLHWSSTIAPAGRRDAQPGPRPSRLARLDGRLRAGQDGSLGRGGRGRQRRRSAGRRAVPARRRHLHPRRARRRAARRRRRPADLPGVRRRPGTARGRRRRPPAGAHNVANALAAAALARARGVAPGAVAEGLRTFVPDPHRNQLVHVAGGVT